MVIHYKTKDYGPQCELIKVKTDPDYLKSKWSNLLFQTACFFLLVYLLTGILLAAILVSLVYSIFYLGTYDKYILTKFKSFYDKNSYFSNITELEFDDQKIILRIAGDEKHYLLSNIQAFSENDSHLKFELKGGECLVFDKAIFMDSSVEEQFKSSVKSHQGQRLNKKLR